MIADNVKVVIETGDGIDHKLSKVVVSAQCIFDNNDYIYEHVTEKGRSRRT